MTPLTDDDIDQLATRMARHIPCTVASIVAAIRGAYADAANEARKSEAKSKKTE